MITRRILNISLLTIALAAASMALPATQARADDSEDMNAPREVWPQQNAYPNQGQNNWGNQYRGYQNRGNAERGKGEQERKTSRFSRNNRDGNGGRDGGGDD